MGASKGNRLRSGRVPPNNGEGYYCNRGYSGLDKSQWMRRNSGQTQVVVAGDFNARIGELKNEVAKEEARERKSQDKVVDARGKRLMKLMNKAGLYVVNGVKEEADFTFEHSNGEGGD